MRLKFFSLILVTALLGLFFAYHPLSINADTFSPENISNTPFGSASNVNPDLEIDPQGNLHAIWMVNNNEGSGLHTYYSARPVGGAWSTPELISPLNVSTVSPSMAIENEGTIHVVWGNPVDNVAPVYYISRAPSGSWTAPINLRAGMGRNETTGASIVVDSQGTLHTTWTDTSFSGRYNVAYSTKPKGGQWSTPENLTNTTTGASHVDIFVGSDNTVYLPVNETIANNSPESAVHLFTKQTGGSWVRSQMPGGFGAPSVVGSDGTLYAVYTSSSQVYFSQKSPGGGWSTPVAPVADNSAVDLSPSINLDGNGTVHLLVHRSFNASTFPSNYNLFYSKRSTSGNWSAPQQLTSLGGIETMPHPGFGDSSSPIRINGNSLHFLWQQGRLDNFSSWQIMYGTILANYPPSLGTITASPNPVQVGTSVSASATFTDPDVGDTHTATWNWGDGTTSSGTVTESNGSGTVTESHTYTTSGVYTITLTVTDNNGGVETKPFEFISVYNPTPQGLFTAGSNFISPAGSGLSGLARFGLSYKYLGGVPVENRQFTMKATNFEFNAITTTSLVISNGKGTLTGTGTVNGLGTYDFLVTGLDNGDTIRIRIKQGDTVIYDTQPGAADTADPTTSVTGQVIVN